jgi:hypothetical protein
MLISEKYKFLFVHIPKTAGTSIKMALEPFCEVKQFDYVPSEDRLKSKPDNSFKIRLHTKLSNELASEHAAKYKFCVVRNSWEWYASYWRFSTTQHHNKHVQNLSWNEYMDYVKIHKPTQASFVYKDEKWLVDDFIIYDGLEEGFIRICNNIGIAAELKHHNQLSSFDYFDLYSLKQKDLIAKICEKEIERFEWKFS